jgi:hypothetical protein
LRDKPAADQIPDADISGPWYTATFARRLPDQLWVIDITALHPGRRGVLRSHARYMVPAGRGQMKIELLNRQRWKTGLELASAIFEYLKAVPDS